MNNSSVALTTLTTSTEEASELPEYIAWTSLILCSIILFVGILGNLLVIIVILTSSVLRSSTNLFLLNLSVADILVLAICTSSSLVEIVTRSDKWILGKVGISFHFQSVFTYLTSDVVKRKLQSRKKIVSITKNSQDYGKVIVHF